MDVEGLSSPYEYGPNRGCPRPIYPLANASNKAAIKTQIDNMIGYYSSGTYLPTLYPGEKTVGVGLGSYKGYSAVALTFKALSDDGKMSWGAGLTTTGKEWGINAGIGWKWK